MVALGFSHARRYRIHSTLSGQPPTHQSLAMYFTSPSSKTSTELKEALGKTLMERGAGSKDPLVSPAFDGAGARTAWFEAMGKAINK